MGSFKQYDRAIYNIFSFCKRYSTQTTRYRSARRPSLRKEGIIATDYYFKGSLPQKRLTAFFAKSEIGTSGFRATVYFPRVFFR
jgi:hypothetical protein